jgi:hypothetical protein
MPISIARGQRERARDEGVGVDARVVDGRRRAHQELEPMAEVAEVDRDGQSWSRLSEQLFRVDKWSVLPRLGRYAE